MLNYKQLYYFWQVAKSGGVTRAAEQLHLTPQTLSGQISELERTLGTELFTRTGRRMELSAAGKLALPHAEQIFMLGKELEALLHNPGRQGELPLRVGLTDAVPKSIAYRLLAPALRLPQPVRLFCHEEKPEKLFAELALHHLDLVISDRPLPASVGVKGYSHLLGRCSLALVGSAELAAACRVDFPHSLRELPLLLPGANAAQSAPLARWLQEKKLAAHVVGEFDDTALMKSFGEAGVGLFPVPEVILDEVCRHYGVELAGRIAEVEVSYYAISLERRLTHPGVLAVSQMANQLLSGKSGDSGTG
ncbi:MAG: LysR family transcriptional regulator [Aeromonadaceae bacterium]